MRAPDLVRIVNADHFGRLEGDDLSVPDGSSQVGCECRNAASLRRVCGNESSLGNGVDPLVASADGTELLRR